MEWEEKTEYILIKSWIARRITEEEANKKQYSDDYYVITANRNLKIIDLDKRAIRPYALELLNSMSELTFTKLSRLTLRVSIACVLFVFIILFRGNWSDWVITALWSKINSVSDVCNKIITQNNNQTNSNITTPVRHTNITTK